ncbi:MAG: valine--tRNA ligase [Proteobacteria bacterium]|nr:valine--tRNA ligase [Pseudomonadota bacterium]
MDKHYDPTAIEGKWYPIWENNGHFQAAQNGDQTYCVMLPPPNVTGSLHMGHAFQDTIMDALIRYHRMTGKRTLWQPGTDHAGIATQMVVERRLAATGTSRHDLGRDAFLEKVWEWKAESGGTITRQMRRLGASCDWSRERFTMDDGLSDAVKEVFVRLYDDGLIYRGKRLVNWDPVLQTAVSDLEVISEEEQGNMWLFRYPLTDGSGSLVVATTRPETMLGDTAVAVNPEDERYAHFIGKTITLPLVGREIPIIADSYVDPAFGTGCVKITPAHDFNDYAIGQRHALPMITILTPTAHIIDDAPNAYRGLDRFDARKRIVADLDALGLLVEIKPHTLMVPRGDRTQSVIEPMLTDQWFVDLTRETQADGRIGGKAAITDPALACVADGRVKFVPENWSNTYNQWLNNIQDWCISRQIWWGHRIPAWYDDNGNIYVARTEVEARSKYSLPAHLELHQDTDVLDTWFSSALWPFSTLGWPNQTADLKDFYPTSTLVTGFDIIFFWVARMVMFGLYFAKDVPFKTVYVHGLVRDAEGQKMSKSKGNVLDPIDLIDGITLDALVAKRTTGLMQPEMAKKIEAKTRKEFEGGIPAYGTDALRFTFASLASNGRDIRFDQKRCEGYRNFCNKLWNATRYVLMNTEGQDTGLNNDDCDYSQADKWIISRLQQTESEVIRHFEQYRLDLLSQEVYDFFWSDYCDWYLELTKPILNNAESSEAQKRAARKTLVRVLEATLRLMHPIMPFITEEIWQRVAPLAGKTGASISNQAFPVPRASGICPIALGNIAWLKETILAVRRLRNDLNVAPSKPINLIAVDATEQDRQRLQDFASYLRFLTKVKQISIENKDPSQAAVAIVGGNLKLFLPMAGLIDFEAEKARLQKEIGKISVEIEKLDTKLSNASFIDKAPAALVEKEKARLTELQTAKANLEKQHAAL